MAYAPYYAPYYRPLNYYNPAMPQDMANAQNQQIPAQQPGQQIPMAQITQMQPTDTLWVLNETEATSYPVAPNNSVTLWDKNQDIIYIKSVNMHGVPSMRVLDYKERARDIATKAPEKSVCDRNVEFVKADQFNALQGKLEALQSEIEALKSKTKTKATKKAAEEDEDGE